MASELDNPANLIIPTDRVPLAAYQALYHKITGKTDRLSREYKGAYLVTKSDLVSLGERLEQSTRQYKVEGQALNFTFLFKEYQNVELSALEKLKFHNFQTIPTATMYAVAEYDFMVVLPSEIKEGENISQRYKVTVTVTQKGDNILWVLSNLEETNKRLEEDIQIKVDYADFAVGRALLSVAEDWVSGLKNDDPDGKCLKKARKRSNALDSLPIYAMLLSLGAAAAFDVTGDMIRCHLFATF